MINLSFNKKEIHKFNRLAKEWWKPSGSMGPLHRINPLRCAFLDARVPLVGKRLLDVGCGGGLFAESMAERGAKVTAIDPAAGLIEEAKKHLAESDPPLPDIDYRVGTVTDLGRDDSYDIVACLEVLEHTPNPQDFIVECVRRIKPGGWGYFSTINRTPAAFLKMILAAEYILGWLPRQTHDYRQFMRPAELANQLRSHKMDVMDMKGIAYDLLRQEFVLSSNVDTNYLLLARKRSN